jgi:tetratricopeptide (TPR) repeat protein
MPHSKGGKGQVLSWDDVYAKFADMAEAMPSERLERELRAMGYDLDRVRAAAGSVGPPGDAPAAAASAPPPASDAAAHPLQPARATARGWQMKSAVAGALGATLVCLLTLAVSHALGDRSQPLLASLDQQSARLLALRRYRDAEPFYRLALSLEEKRSGPQHRMVALRLNNLAQLLRTTERLDEAQSLMLRALAIHGRHFASDPISVARDLNNVAQLLEARDRPEEAERTYRYALALMERYRGATHPDVATVLNNLAHLLKTGERLEEAEAMMLRALAIDMHHYGPHHDAVARDHANLRLVRQATAGCGEYKGKRHVEKASLVRRGDGAAADAGGHPGQVLQLTRWLAKVKVVKACAL